MTSFGKGISVGIKTFLRPKALDACLYSLCGYEWDEVIIADDSPSEAEYEYDQVYSFYRSELPLRVLRLPIDTGLAEGRNQIVSACSSEYLLMLDDDQSIDSSIDRMADVLKGDESLGGVSGIWLERGFRGCTGCNIFVDSGYVVKEIQKQPKEQLTPHGTRYVCLDFVPNSTLFRVSCLKELLWDPEYKIGREHVDFYLRHKYLGRWSFAVCLDAQIFHQPELGVDEYASYRYGRREGVSEAYFRRKFGVEGVMEGKKLIGGRKFFTMLHRHGVPVRTSWMCDSVWTWSKRKVGSVPRGIRHARKWKM